MVPGATDDPFSTPLNKPTLPDVGDPNAEEGTLTPISRGDGTSPTRMPSVSPTPNPQPSLPGTPEQAPIKLPASPTTPKAARDPNEAPIPGQPR